MGVLKKKKKIQPLLKNPQELNKTKKVVFISPTVTKFFFFFFFTAIEFDLF